MQKATVLILAILLLLPLSTARDDEGSQENAAPRNIDIATRCGGTRADCNEPAGQSCCNGLKCVNNCCWTTTDGCPS
nr:conotoxin precursor Y [Conus judaeus]DAZ86900.1 TPA_inf: conotoxin precursor Y [Conus judaeus]